MSRKWTKGGRKGREDGQKGGNSPSRTGGGGAARELKGTIFEGVKRKDAVRRGGRGKVVRQGKKREKKKKGGRHREKNVTRKTEEERNALPFSRRPKEMFRGAAQKKNKQERGDWG